MSSLGDGDQTLVAQLGAAHNGYSAESADSMKNMVMGRIAAALVLVAHAFTKPAEPGVPDQLIQAGSCVQIDNEGFAVEVSCTGPHTAVVESFVAFDQTCPAETLAHLDRQGMGKACVRPVSESG